MDHLVKSKATKTGDVRLKNSNDSRTNIVLLNTAEKTSSFGVFCFPEHWKDETTFLQYDILLNPSLAELETYPTTRQVPQTACSTKNTLRNEVKTQIWTLTRKSKMFGCFNNSSLVNYRCLTLNFRNLIES